MRLIVIVAALALGGCAMLATEQRLDALTDTSKAERCLEYQLTLAQYESMADIVSGGLPSERRERIEKLRGLIAVVCEGVDEDVPRDDAGVPGRRNTRPDDH